MVRRDVSYFNLDVLRRKYGEEASGGALESYHVGEDFFFCYRQPTNSRWMFDVGRQVLLDSPTLIYVHSGRTTIVCDSYEYTASAGDVLLVRSGVTLCKTASTPDHVVSCIAFDESYMRPMQEDEHFRYSYQQHSLFVLSLSSEEQYAMNRYLDFCWFLSSQVAANARTLNSLMMSILLYVDSVSHSRHSIAELDQGRASDTFNQFLGLVNEHSSEERGLDFYASELNISKKYLCTLVKSVSDFTAKDWIDRSVVSRAKDMLTHTDKSVAEIADELNFSQVTTFCKLFKRTTSYTPLEWRGEHHFRR